MQLNPNEVIKRGIVTGLIDVDKQVQQVGIDLTLREKTVILQGEYVNVQVNEKFDMQNTFGLIRVRSSLSRMGVFISSGVYDPGFKGPGGVSMYNMSDDPIVLQENERIAQIIVFTADAASEYDGHYNHTDKIESKIVGG